MPLTNEGQFKKLVNALCQKLIFNSNNNLFFRRHINPVFAAFAKLAIEKYKNKFLQLRFIINL